jgi:hypothetical protein
VGVRHCLCGNARRGPWTRDQCSICWHELYGAEILKAARPVRVPRSPATCRHGGPDLGRTRECAACKGAVRLKLFACAVHGAVAARDCAACPDFEVSHG